VSLGRALAAMARTGQSTAVGATVVRWIDAESVHRARFTDPMSPLHNAPPDRRSRSSPAHSRCSLRYFVRSNHEVGLQVMSSTSAPDPWPDGRARVPVELRPLGVLERLHLQFLHDHDLHGRPAARLRGTLRPGRSPGHNPPWSDADEELLDVDMESGYLLHTEVRWRGNSVITSDLVDIVPGENGPDEAFAPRTVPQARAEPAVALEDWYAALTVAPFAVFAPRRSPADADVHLVWWPARSDVDWRFSDGALETRVVQPYGDRCLRITQGRSRLAPPDPELWRLVGSVERPIHGWMQPPQRWRRALQVLIVDLGDTEAEVLSNLDHEDAVAVASSLEVLR